MAKRILGFLLLACTCLLGCVSGRVNGAIGGGGGGTATGQLYVATPSSILRFSGALTANGNIAPTATISGAATGLSAPQRIFLDPATNRLFVANQGGNSILVFDNVSNLNGNIAPSRTLVGASTQLSAPTDLAVDTANNLLYVANGTHILVFAAASTINGNSPPVRNINMGVTVDALFLDQTNNQLYVADSVSNAVDRLDGASSQDVIGIVGGAIAGPLTLLSSPNGMTLDATGRLLVSNSSAPLSVTIYSGASAATGNIAPAASISGAATGFLGPGPMAFNRTVTTGEVFIADSLAAGIFIYTNSNTATGNLAPSRTISGAATTLVANGIKGIALDTTR
jgi:hypothetical protein